MSSDREKIVILDDDMANLTMGSHILKTFYDVTPVSSAAKFQDILFKVAPSLVLLDIEMPEMNGFEVIKKMKANPRFADIPVIFLTSKNDVPSEVEGFELGGADYISKPFSPPILLKRIENQLLILKQKKDLLANQEKLKDYADHLQEKVLEKTKDLIDLQNAVLVTVSDLVEFRDKLTGSHILRTQLYLKALVEELVKEGIYKDVISKWDIDLFIASAPLHDVGKIAITDLILNKPDKLTIDEFEIMKTHVTAGIDAIERIMHHTNNHAFLKHALLVAGTHHEKWDGTGYCTGLKGDNIPMEGRLMAISDVYDALISVRSYKKALTHEEACRIMEGNSGTNFDPVLVGVFKNVEAEFNRIAREHVAA